MAKKKASEKEESETSMESDLFGMDTTFDEFPESNDPPEVDNPPANEDTSTVADSPTEEPAATPQESQPQETVSAQEPRVAADRYFGRFRDDPVVRAFLHVLRLQGDRQRRTVAEWNEKLAEFKRAPR